VSVAFRGVAPAASAAATAEVFEIMPYADNASMDLCLGACGVPRYGEPFKQPLYLVPVQGGAVEGHSQLPRVRYGH